MTEKEKQTLEKKLWDIANDLRGNMGADEFRDYILGFIFYKYLSEKMVIFANNLLREDKREYIDLKETGGNDKELLEAIQKESITDLGYFLKPSQLFSEITKKSQKQTDGKYIMEELDPILKYIEQSTMGTDSEDDFDGLFDDIDLTSNKLGRQESDKHKLIIKVFIHLNEIDFKMGDSKSDILGDAYEYLISKFASGAGAKAGEFYTPQEVSVILAKIVTSRKNKLRSVYDPTCGSGSLLLRVKREVQEIVKFYGQEKNPTAYNLARMNMVLHDVHYREFDIRQEDTLNRPEHKDQKFEAIVANPPFSAQWSANSIFMNDDRFSQYGKLAPRTKADYAFVQHMIHHLTDNGIMAVVLPHGVLFRGAAEGHIRKYLIENRNYLDAVIGLPANIFYGTSIPTCILVFKKCREHSENILFIDASKYFKKVRNKNKLREEDIEKIIKTYQERKQEDKYSYVAKLKEIEENEYNLNIPRYVDTFEEEEEIDIERVAKEIKEIDQEMLGVDEKVKGFCEDLGIESPF